MEAPNDMTLALERRLVPASEHPETAHEERSEHRLEIAVVFTDPTLTIAALKKAGAVAGRLKARINLVVTQAVPYAVPLESPPILIDFSEQRFREIATQSRVETTVRI